MSKKRVKSEAEKLTGETGLFTLVKRKFATCCRRNTQECLENKAENIITGHLWCSPMLRTPDTFDRVVLKWIKMAVGSVGSKNAGF